MPVEVSQVSNTQTFGTWLARTNQLASIISTNTVTTGLTAVGAVTTGNATVNGFFGSNTMFVTQTLRGGNVYASNTLSVSSNVIFKYDTSDLVTINGNTSSSNLLVTTVTASFVTTNFSTISNVATVNAISQISLISPNITATAANTIALIGSTSLRGNTTYNILTSNSIDYSLTSNAYTTRLNSNVVVVGSTLQVSSNTTTFEGQSFFNDLLTANVANVTGDLFVRGSLQVTGNLVYLGTSTGDFLPPISNSALGDPNVRWFLYSTGINSTGGVTVTGSNTNFYNGTLFIDSSKQFIGVGNSTPNSKFTVAGNVEFTSLGGIKFSDGSFMNSAPGTFNFGANTRVTFSNGSAYTSSGGLTFDYAANNLSVANTISTSNVTASNTVSSGKNVINSLVHYDARIVPFTATTSVMVDSFATASFRSAEYLIQIKAPATNSYHITKLLLVHDGGNALVTEYGTIASNNALGYFTAYISGGTVSLNCTPTFANSTATISRIAIVV